jgi:hypothetical protein
VRAPATLVALVLAVLVRDARADDDAPQLQKMRFVERGDALTVSTVISQLFDNPAYNALDSGFTSTVVIRVWVYPKDSQDPISFVLLRRQVVYNLWDEAYELRFDEPSGRRDFKEKRKSEALKQLTSIDDLPIARLTSIPHESIFLLALQVELNPVSKETLAAVRRWLTQGQGGGLDRGGAFFGSFVSVFVNPKIPEADRVVRLRSQPFFRPKP